MTCTVLNLPGIGKFTTCSVLSLPGIGKYMTFPALSLHSIHDSGVLSTRVLLRSIPEPGRSIIPFCLRSLTGLPFGATDVFFPVLRSSSLQIISKRLQRMFVEMSTPAATETPGLLCEPRAFPLLSFPFAVLISFLLGVSWASGSADFASVMTGRKTMGGDGGVGGGGDGGWGKSWERAGFQTGSIDQDLPPFYIHGTCH